MIPFVRHPRMSIRDLKFHQKPDYSWYTNEIIARENRNICFGIAVPHFSCSATITPNSILLKSCLTAIVATRSDVIPSSNTCFKLSSNDRIALPLLASYLHYLNTPGGISINFYAFLIHYLILDSFIPFQWELRGLSTKLSLLKLTNDWSETIKFKVS